MVSQAETGCLIRQFFFRGKQNLPYREREPSGVCLGLSAMTWPMDPPADGKKQKSKTWPDRGVVVKRPVHTVFSSTR